MVLGNCSHKLRFQCMVGVMLHAIHREISMISVVSVNKSLVQVLHQFQMVLSFWCNLLVMAYLQVPRVQPYLLVLFECGKIRLFPIGNSCSGQLMHSQGFFSITNHLFYLFLDCQKFCMRECDRDKDQVIALYQFKWGMNLFSMSSIVVCEFQSAERV
jgi:hypothetical protein